MRGPYRCHDGMCGAIDCVRCNPGYDPLDEYEKDEDGNPIDENGEIINTEPDCDEDDVQRHYERRGW